MVRHVLFFTYFGCLFISFVIATFIVKELEKKNVRRRLQAAQSRKGD